MRQATLLSLSALLAGCSAVYDADDFGVCEVPDVAAAPPCAPSVARCFTDTYEDCVGVCDREESCMSECLGPCYDIDGDPMMWSAAELECVRCVSFVGGLNCLRDAGCAAEADAIYCCVEALCDPIFGCTEGQCDEELSALGSCAAGLTPGLCGEDTYLECFQS